MTKHRGTTTPKPEWWKHLRKHLRGNVVGWKRVFWKRDRQAGKKETT